MNETTNEGQGNINKGANAMTLEKVKVCVQQKYAQLGSRCKMQLAAAGLTQAATSGFSR